MDCECSIKMGCACSKLRETLKRKADRKRYDEAVAEIVASGASALHKVHMLFWVLNEHPNSIYY